MADAVNQAQSWRPEPDAAPAERRRPFVTPTGLGSRRPPPGPLQLPLESSRHLWLGVHLADPGLLHAVAARCERFTSWVSLEPPDGVLLEVQGSLGLFGGLHALVEKVREELKAQGAEARLAVTPAPASALWLARAQVKKSNNAIVNGHSGGGSALSASGPPRSSGAVFAKPASSASTDEMNGRSVPMVEHLEELPRKLASVPLGCLRWPQEQARLLEDLGVATVGDLARLPRAGLLRRLGKEWVRALDHGLGHAEEPRRPFHAPEVFTDAFEPDDPVNTTARLEALLAPRLEALKDFLRSRQAAIGSLSIRLLHGNRPRTGLLIAPATPCSDVERFAHLLHERLQQVRLSAPVVAVRMRSGPLFADAPASGSLMQRTDARFRTDAQALPRLVECLRTRLGAEALQGIRALADRRPEKAWANAGDVEGALNASARFGIAASASAGISTSNGVLTGPSVSASLPPAFPQRPVWLRFAPDLLPRDARAQWTLECGPERIESGWWDGGDVARDYFIVRHRQGARLWVYRERQPPHCWYLQGWFG